MGLMQVIPRFHADKFDATNRASVLDRVRTYRSAPGSEGIHPGRGAPGSLACSSTGALSDASNAY
jgi:hypothetical protein